MYKVQPRTTADVPCPFFGPSTPKQNGHSYPAPTAGHPQPPHPSSNSNQQQLCPQAGSSGVNMQARRSCAATHTLCTPWLHSQSAIDIHRQTAACGKTQHSQFHTHCRPPYQNLQSAAAATAVCTGAAHQPTTAWVVRCGTDTAQTPNMCGGGPHLPHAACRACKQCCQAVGRFQQACDPTSYSYS